LNTDQSLKQGWLPSTHRMAT